MSSIEQLAARLSNLEQILINALVGGRIPFPWPNPPGDSFATDSTRVAALLRTIGGRGPIPDPFVTDITRLSLTEVENQANEIAAAVTRLQARQGELTARLQELRANPA